MAVSTIRHAERGETYPVLNYGTAWIISCIDRRRPLTVGCEALFSIAALPILLADRLTRAAAWLSLHGGILRPYAEPAANVHVGQD